MILLCACSFSCTNDNEKQVQNLHEELLRMNDEVNTLKRQLNSLNRSVGDLRVQISDGKIPEASIANSSFPSQSIVGSNNSQSSEINQLVSKLRGIEYTEADIDRLKKLDANKAHVNLILSAQACLKLCNIPVKEKPQINDPKTFVGKAIVKPILDGNVVAHIEFLRRIQKGGDLAASYMLDKHRSHITVKATVIYYEEDL